MRVAMEVLRLSVALFNAVPENHRSEYIDWIKVMYGVLPVPAKQGASMGSVPG